ncbi:MAG TPA: kelch repeat-containing protein [bacterium]|nr:kelch repeat-containing protein [bacterium]
MTNRFFLLFVTIISMLVLSCGGDDASDQVGGDDSQIALTLLAAECPDYIGGSNIKEQLGSLAVQFYTEAGTLVKVNGKNAVSLSDDNLSDEVKVTGIPDINNARVVFSGFEKNNVSSPKWRGVVRGVDFKKGKETVVSVVLYPVYGMGCFPQTLLSPRFGHAVTELPDGRLLVSGGFTETSNGVWQATDKVELLDPESGTVDQLTAMKEYRAFHVAVALPDGRVVITGGVKELDMKALDMTDESGYPDLPLTFKTSPVGVELYTVNLAKKNQRPDGVVDASTVEYIDLSDDKFFPFQSYAYVRSDEETGAGTIFMVGGVKDGAGLPNIYGVEISVGEDQKVTATVNQYNSTNTETFVAPLVAAAGTDRVFVLGGHPKTSSKFAHLISAGTLEEWSGNAPNLFFGSIAADTVNNIVVAASGLELPKDATAFSMNGNSYRFNLSDSTGSEGPLFWGTWLHDMVFNGTDGYFSVVGGVGGFDTTAANIEANNFLEHVSIDTMDFNDTAYEYIKVKRALHRTVVTADKMMYITGGIEDIKGTALVDTIELLYMNKPSF